MKLNLPILDLIKDSKNILIMGIGGGFDIFCGLPICFELANKNIILANYSTNVLDPEKFNQLKTDQVNSLHGVPYVKAVTGTVTSKSTNFPEGYLTEWFEKYYKKSRPVWMFFKTGVRPLKKALSELIDVSKIDAVILVDGGVDSLMQGNEKESGTCLEDSVVLAAFSEINVPVKILACLGFGTEIEDKIDHFSVLQNMAQVIRDDGFYGTCSLVKTMNSFRLYEKACRYVWGQEGHKKSHISTKIIPAVYGEFDQYAMYAELDMGKPFINPLMGLYWFFNADVVIKNNLLVNKLKLSSTWTDAQVILRQFSLDHSLRPKRSLPY